MTTKYEEDAKPNQCSKGALAIAALGVLLSACATVFNEPINVPVGSDVATVSPAPPPSLGGDTVVGLAFSGGVHAQPLFPTA